MSRLRISALLTLIVLLATGCATWEHRHQQPEPPVVIPPGTDFQKLYLESQAQLAAEKVRRETMEQIRTEYLRELQVRQLEQEQNFREWQRNTGARMHRPN